MKEIPKFRKKTRLRIYEEWLRIFTKNIYTNGKITIFKEVITVKGFKPTQFHVSNLWFCSFFTHTFDTSILTASEDLKRTLPELYEFRTITDQPFWYNSKLERTEALKKSIVKLKNELNNEKSKTTTSSEQKLYHTFC